MNSYFYPSKPYWFEKALEKWKSSGEATFVFPFLKMKPSTLPTEKNAPFWMYIYYSEHQVEGVVFQRVVKFRVRVISFNFSIIEGKNIYTHRDSESQAEVWFQCDLVEEIKNLNGSYLRESDFKHSLDDVVLLQAIRDSIAPVQRISPMVTVQSTWHCIND